MLDKRKTYRLKMELKAIGRALRLLCGAFIRLNVISQKIAKTQTRRHTEERPKEPVTVVATAIYEEWLIWTYGATDMSNILKMKVRHVPFVKAGEFEDLLKDEFFITKRREREYVERREEKEEKEKREALLIESLASLEHDQWCEWSKEIIESEPISPAHKAFWKSMWVPYELVSEVCKQINRKLAREKLKLIRDSEAFWRKKDVENIK